MPEAPAPDTETAPPADPQPEPRPGRKARRAMAAEVAGDRVQGMRYLPFLKALHARQRPEWYLEIGTFKGRSLRLVGCNYVAVDPAFRLTDVPPLTGQEMTFFRGTSDAFFAGDRAKSLRGRIDLAFLDGLHHYEVLLRDVINVEPLMARDGIIVLHDCLPGSLASASRVHTPGLDWAGDVWKTLLILQRERPDLRIDVLDCAPTGLVLLRGFSPARARSMKRRHAALCAEWDGVSLETLPGGLDGFYERQRLQNARDALSGIGS